MTIFTIGFTKKSAETFFEMLRRAQVKRLVDVRLNNVSQLAGFTKRDDLRYFLRAICAIEYMHRPDLAPTQQILDAYKKNKGEWSTYKRQFLELLKDRRVDETIPRGLMDGACLLCSEDRPDHCHRRLIAEYLSDRWSDVKIEHLV